jgi:hypothetical protein
MPIGWASYWKALHELLDVLVEHRVQRDLARPRLELGLRRQFAKEDEVRRFEEVAPLGQLLDRITPVLEDAFVAVDVRDAAPARRGVLKRRVVRHQAEVVACGLDLRRSMAPIAPSLMASS